MEYTGAYGECSCERTIEKSRFLGYCARTVSEEELHAFLRRLRAEHSAATHIVYGGVLDSLGNLQRFSDDGEPQGTAGLPVLGVVKAQKLFETSVAVVRYFGGIKLGAGGLTRAYASLAAEAAELAEKRRFAPCLTLCLTVDYPEAGALIRFLEKNAPMPAGREFGEDARFTVNVEESKAERFIGDVTSVLLGRVKISEKGRGIFPFPIG